jgi:hypothetical protein
VSKYNYERHCSSLKHIKLFNIKPDTPFECSKCNKKYKYQSGFYRHKKSCQVLTKKPEKPLKNLNEIDLLKKDYETKLRVEKIKNKLKIKEIETTNYIKQLNTTKSTQPRELNNQLIDIILDKNKVIEGLKTTIKKKPELQAIQESENIDLNEIIKIQDQKIKILEDLFVKKQKRQSFPEKNVIYILTTEENKKNRIYIIGKAKELKNRLSTYNKTSEHEVIYYKGCNDEDDLKIIEQNVLRKLRNYKEKANRDRFVLPIEKDITFFTKVVDHCINDIDNDNLD